MSVYVDDMNASFGRMTMCHMIADNHFELLAMCNLIGVQHKFIQAPGTPKEHFDICQSKRTLAIQNGAIAISYRELAAKVHERSKPC